MFDLMNHYNAHAFRVMDSKTAPMRVNNSLRDLQIILLEDFFLVIWKYIFDISREAR